MRTFVVLLMVVGLVGCGLGQTQSQSEQALIGNDAETRHRLAIQDAEAILKGMAQARERAELLARTAR